MSRVCGLPAASQPGPAGRPSGAGQSTLRICLAFAIWAAAATGSILLLAHAQAQGRQEIEQRFALRASIASNFVTTYVRDLTRRQAEQAARHLSSPRVSGPGFRRTVGDAGFGAAVLLDDHGRLLRLEPPNPSLLGKDITGKYAHLKAAVGGRVAVSKVVRSAVEGVPVVAFAVPFATREGRRVYSGAYDISTTPAGAYLRNAIPIPQSRLYLVDSSGVVIAKNGAPLRGMRTLSESEPALARALEDQREGAFDAEDQTQRYASAAVAGMPWRVVVAVPGSLLYASATGAAQWLPWAAVAGFIVASLLAVVLFLRVAQGRVRLAGLNARLERIARVDALTDLYNRRGLDEHLAQATSAARRHERPLSLMLLDIDRFKRINDAYGHQAGDAVLAQVANTLQLALRTEDVLGRWGGEEFLAVLRDTDLDAAVGLAERLRTTVADVAIALPDGSHTNVTISIGVSAGTSETTDERIASSDQALYAAKEGGRNRVAASRQGALAQ